MIRRAVTGEAQHRKPYSVAVHPARLRINRVLAASVLDAVLAAVAAAIEGHQQIGIRIISKLLRWDRGTIPAGRARDVGEPDIIDLAVEAAVAAGAAAIRPVERIQR